MSSREAWKYLTFGQHYGIGAKRLREILEGEAMIVEEFEVFEASNGVRVRHLPDRGVEYIYANEHWEKVFNGQPGSLVDRAVAEYYRHREDVRLGRVRYPEDQNIVIYPQEVGDVLVLSEKTADVERWSRGEARQKYNCAVLGFEAASWYFDNNPEKKPWHDAKQNELWELQIKGCYGGPEVYRFAQVTSCADSKAFRPVNNPEREWIEARNEKIETARRIWPETKEDDK